MLKILLTIKTMNVAVKRHFNSVIVKSIDVYLRNNIPEYMIPNYLFKIKKFPLTQNIKLDINSLIQTAKKRINVQR